MNQNLYYNLLYLPFTFLSISYVLDGLIVGHNFIFLADLTQRAGSPLDLDESEQKYL
ncbi:MAG: hypothetical protein QXH93_05800 [Conexivisphaerales archaeon]